MGYDCTLHVVDERLIRERFVPKLLGKDDSRSPFDDRADSGALWKQVRGMLSGERPDVEANSVCQFAIAYCAAELPYHSERGFCLSLWPEQPDGLAAKVPAKFVGDPSKLFEPLVAKYPALRGKFPKEIRSNYCSGLFVPAASVPSLLAWIEKRVKKYAKPDQRLFRGLILVLREAADRGLAYWEGTELPVEMRTITPSKPSGLADDVPFREGWASHVAAIGSIAIFSSGPGADGWTAIVDLSQWPPKIDYLPEYSLAAARSQGGRCLTISAAANRENAYHYRAHLRRDSWSAPPTLLELEGPSDQLGLANGGFAGERVIAFRQLETEHKLFGMPLLESDGKLVPIKGKHPIQRERDWAYPDVSGVIRLNDSADVIVWAGKGYEIHDDQLRVTFPEIKLTYKSRFQGVPWEADGFFHIGREENPGGRFVRQNLFFVRRGSVPERVFDCAENLMYLRPGPNGSLLLKQGQNRNGDLGVIYFPNEDYFYRLQPELFPDEDPDEIQGLHLAAGDQRLVASTQARLWSIPLDRVLNGPRYNASSGEKLKC